MGYSDSVLAPDLTLGRWIGLGGLPTIVAGIGGTGGMSDDLAELITRQDSRRGNVAES